MQTYMVIPAKRPTGRVSPVLPGLFPATDEPTRPQLPADPVPAIKANGRHEEHGPVPR